MSNFLFYREQGYGDIIKLIPGTLENKLKRMEDCVAKVVRSIPECPVTRNSHLYLHLGSFSIRFVLTSIQRKDRSSSVTRAISFVRTVAQI